MDLKEVAEEVLERCCTEELICFKKTMVLHSSCLKKIWRGLLNGILCAFGWEVKIGNFFF